MVRVSGMSGMKDPGGHGTVLYHNCGGGGGYTIYKCDRMKLYTH